MKSRGLSLLVASMLLTGNVSVATANAAPNAAVNGEAPMQVEAALPENTDIHEHLEKELDYLDGLSDPELEAELAPLEQGDATSPRLAPLVVVAAIGCAVSIGGAVFTKAWEDSNSAVWALAGVLTGCIPGAQQAKVVNVIIKNKRTIAAALKKVGAFSLASAILAANIAPVAIADK